MGTEEFVFKTLLSRLVTGEFVSPVNSSRTLSCRTSRLETDAVELSDLTLLSHLVNGESHPAVDACSLLTKANLNRLI